ncbi:MAG: presenilin family intramembrane aspartyl protease, partial [Candidatus Pacearchaeota archaeon]
MLWWWSGGQKKDDLREKGFFHRMKHKPKVVAVLLVMFLVTQFIGLYVVNYYNSPDNELPYGMEPPKIQEEKEYYSIFPSLIIAFLIAVAVLFLLMKFRIEVILRLWFLLVVTLALSLAINTLLPGIKNAALAALAIGFPLALIKIFQRNMFVHNLTELFIYPGIAAVFVPILNIYTAVGLLLLISFYDMWAVWKSQIMQKMAHYHVNTLKVFSGFFVPYLSKNQRQKLKQLKKQKHLENKKTKEMKVNVAALGGGDVVFPIIAAGVIGKVAGIGPAIFTSLGALGGLAWLFTQSQPKKFYPAMPFITIGTFLGMI